jgi:hypothetical protein
MVCFFAIGAVAAEPDKSAPAGTYELLICKDACSFSEANNVLVKGRLVLFADKLEKIDLDRFDERRFDYHFGEAIDGCYTLETVHNSEIYAGIEKVGLTSWSQQGDEFQFSLYHSPDAGYQATVKRTTDGLSGNGNSWGAGVAAPEHPTKEIILARRTGDADIFKCTFQTPEEAEQQRLLADPARKEISALEEAYRNSLIATLQSSVSPRDWAMAGWLMSDEKGDAPIRRARKAAHDDRLIQWIAVHHVRPFNVAVPIGATGLVGYELRYKDLDSTALAALQREEPDNAAVWLVALRNAVNADSESAISTAIAHLAACKYYDNHASDLLKAQRDLYATHPLPSAYFEAVQRLDGGWRLHGEFTKDVAPYYGNHYPFASIGINNLFFMSNQGDGLHELFVVCTQRAGRSQARTLPCANIAKMLATQSRRYDVRENGSMLLGELNRFDDADIQRARTTVWVAEQSWKIHRNDAGVDKPHVSEDVAFIDDWIATGDEFEAMRRDVERAGKPLQPPPDWQLNKAVYGNFVRAPKIGANP